VQCAYTKESPQIISFLGCGLWAFSVSGECANKRFIQFVAHLTGNLGEFRGGIIPFGSGFPIGAGAPCWQWFPKAAALPWQEGSNETGGFVAHDFARKV